MNNPSLDIRLYGTSEQVEPPRLLRAGKLTAELEAGNLRYIRFAGIELIRAISFIVRDKDWGTYNPIISDLKLDLQPEGFAVTYLATAADEQQNLTYRASIVGDAEGRLNFSAKAEAGSDFVTNRTGFVVLHPVEGVAGQPVTIEHVDGRLVESSFPELIDPLQPMMDLRALTHEPVPGLKVTCRMEGDTFEMEDQRNWTDASYKTYVRPLALPWPYTIAAGETLEQKVELKISGAPREPGKRDQGRVTVSIGEAIGTLPPLGIGLEPELASATFSHAADIKSASPQHLVCHYDPRQGHGRSEIELALEVARQLGCDAWLEAVVPSVESFEADIEQFGRMAGDLGNPFSRVLLSPAPDLKCTLPGSPWPPCPPLDKVYQAGRKAFPGAHLGGGMFSYFTELNRKRPPVEHLDFISFTTSGLVHAGDDRSATEGLESLPFIALSAKAIAKGKPYHVGPSALGMRANPYGEAPMENPRNIRQAMNRVDPRQRGLLGAAWMLGYIAHFARSGAESLTLGGGVGPFGLVYAPMSYEQPFFDEAGGYYPVFHVFRGLARRAGSELLETQCGVPREVQAVAIRRDGRLELWLANLTGEERTVVLNGDVQFKSHAQLNSDSFLAAARTSDFVETDREDFSGGELRLAPYAVAHLAA